MVDARFFRANKPLSLADICQITEGALAFGVSEVLVHKVASSNSVKAGEACFVADSQHARLLPPKSAAIVLTKEELVSHIDGASAVIVVSNPRLAFAQLSSALISNISEMQDMRHLASIDGSATIDSSAIIGAFSTIAAGVVIGKDVVVEPSVFIGAGVEIGDGCHIGSHAHIETCVLGHSVSVGAQSVIGKSGFGFEMTDAGAVKIPHHGRVLIGHNCTIGANCTIDRGVMEDTVLGDSVMIDNLVQIAHNVQIGDRSIILAQTGIAGSAVIGSDCIIAAQVGIKDHIEITSKTVILSRSAVTKSINQPGTYAGFPAQIAKDEWREQASLRQLVKMRYGKGKSDD